MRAKNFFRSLGEGVRLVFSDRGGRRIVASWPRGGRPILNLHLLFQNAPLPVLESVARLYLGRPRARAARRYRRQIQGFVRANGPAPRGGREAPVLGPRGRFFDLDGILRGLNRRFFAGSLDLDVTWSSRPMKSLLGTWEPGRAGGRNRVTINCRLDDPRVPRFYLRYLVYHEMLHEIFPQPRRAGRIQFHPPEYRQAERRFPDYVRAADWARARLTHFFEPPRNLGAQAVRKNSVSGGPRRR